MKNLKIGKTSVDYKIMRASPIPTLYGSFDRTNIGLSNGISLSVLLRRFSKLLQVKDDVWTRFEKWHECDVSGLVEVQNACQAIIGAAIELREYCDQQLPD